MKGIHDRTKSLIFFKQYANQYKINDTIFITAKHFRDIKPVKNFSLIDDSSIFWMLCGVDLFGIKTCDSS